MKNLIFFLFLFTFSSCKVADKYSDENARQFMDDITSNAKCSINDQTSIQRERTSDFIILTRCPLSEKELQEYKENNGTIRYRDDNLATFVVSNIKSYNLTDEENNNVKIINDYFNLQVSSLWTYDDILCQNLILKIEADKKFEKLTGQITVVFQLMDIKKEVIVPVNISIYDALPE